MGTADGSLPFANVWRFWGGTRGQPKRMEAMSPAVLPVGGRVGPYTWVPRPHPHPLPGDPDLDIH